MSQRSGEAERPSANTVAAITRIFPHASTFPCLVTTQTGEEWVMKLRGSGPGPMALLTEFLALRVAASMGLTVPATQPLYLPSGFPWTIGTDEFDGIVQRSFGWNLGVRLVPDARPASAGEIDAAKPDFLDVLAQADRLLVNMDRSGANPNILINPEGLVAIDFDACLFVRRAARGVVPTDYPLPPGHLLSGRPLSSPRPVDVEVMRQALVEAPPSWLVETGLQHQSLLDNLGDYVRAWNAQSPA